MMYVGLGKGKYQLGLAVFMDAAAHLGFSHGAAGTLVHGLCCAVTVHLDDLIFNEVVLNRL